ncbi:OmpA family protein [Arcobacter porcinus]|uniref:Peptidoglycan-associated outer membrane lipoprotein n=1 Tax=Arcobacter porcinus TaxID=1935204 RepID=A0ABX2YDX1_9BACT|nr:OmpA family protein [Arcobacter porcinus]OCL93189.1 peptidoglycan-associated outer membrane lipoprotein [Arcobacter porcinus]
MNKIIILIIFFSLGLNANKINLKDDKEKIHNLNKIIYFSRGAKKTNSNQDIRLKKHAEYMIKTKDIKLLLEAYTDNVGDREVNNWMALDYAKACKETLVKFGVDASRISITTFGASKSTSNEIRDRKVEFVYYY